jgi:very-short-patch-repair endonuclease
MDNQLTTGMFKGANAKIFQFAEENRLKPTAAEAVLWNVLKGNKLDGRKFRRQHPIGNYILDFYCHSEKLGIEIDGEYHDEASQKMLDMDRTNAIVTENIKIIRFTNEQITNNLVFVIGEIKNNFRYQSS